jgi:transcriptional regulator GlxA family with amidase domain
MEMAVQRVGFIVFSGYQVMAFAALSVFEVANQQAGRPVYDVQILSETGGLIQTSIGMTIGSKAFDDTVYDTLIIGGGGEIEPPTAGLVRFVQESLGRSRRIASICSGAFVLAEAGLLDGRRATTHWIYARAFQGQFPNVNVDEDRIFVNDGPMWTSAGMSAGIDLALAMVEQDLGADLARIVAKKLVVYHRRAGGQSQYSALLELEPKSDRIQSVLSYAKRNLHTPLSVPQLAEVARLSPRQFSRAFHSETGQSPAKAVENLRVEAARLLMEEGRHPVDVVAQMTGFADPDRMRRAFLRAYGQPPQVIRRNARAAA